jgi:hypothetical protein
VAAASRAGVHLVEIAGNAGLVQFLLVANHKHVLLARATAALHLWAEGVLHAISGALEAFDHGVADVFPAVLRVAKSRVLGFHGALQELAVLLVGATPGEVPGWSGQGRHGTLIRQRGMPASRGWMPHLKDGQHRGVHVLLKGGFGCLQRAELGLGRWLGSRALRNGGLRRSFCA